MFGSLLPFWGSLTPGSLVIFGESHPKIRVVHVVWYIASHRKDGFVPSVWLSAYIGVEKATTMQCAMLWLHAAYVCGHLFSQVATLPYYTIT